MKTTSQTKDNWLEITKSFILALLLALLFRSFFYEPYKIPSGSMKPNLLVGDYLFVSKFSYGFSRYSFPLGLNIFKGRVLEFNQPQRGDIIVFKIPKDISSNYIKRLVGLPGDKIQMINGVLHINGSPLKKEPAGIFIDSDGNKIPRFIETMPNGKSYYVLDEVPDGTLDNTKIYEVPEGHYFFMGDNRDNSADSRVLYSMGYVSKEYLIGKAELIFFSSNAAIWEIWKWFSEFRPERMVKPIQSLYTK